MQLSVKDVTIIEACLRTNKHLTSLNLLGNKLGLDSAEVLHAALRAKRNSAPIRTFCDFSPAMTELDWSDGNGQLNEAMRSELPLLSCEVMVNISLIKV